jgi:hypothetical protein
MIDEQDAYSHAVALIDRARRVGHPLDRAQSLAITDLRSVLADEAETVLENVAHLLALHSDTLS